MVRHEFIVDWQRVSFQPCLRLIQSKAP